MLSMLRGYKSMKERLMYRLKSDVEESKAKDIPEGKTRKILRKMTSWQETCQLRKSLFPA